MVDAIVIKFFDREKTWKHFGGEKGIFQLEGNSIPQNCLIYSGIEKKVVL
jgi:hypothetical protein